MHSISCLPKCREEILKIQKKKLEMRGWRVSDKENKPGVRLIRKLNVVNPMYKLEMNSTFGLSFLALNRIREKTGYINKNRQHYSSDA